jgi:hypothetical protein
MSIGFPQDSYRNPIEHESMYEENEKHEANEKHQEQY